MVAWIRRPECAMATIYRLGGIKCARRVPSSSDLDRFACLFLYGCTRAEVSRAKPFTDISKLGSVDESSPNDSRFCEFRPDAD